MVMEFCRQHHLPMASHDDTLVEHVEEALSNGISISEFPTTTGGGLLRLGKRGCWS